MLNGSRTRRFLGILPCNLGLRGSLVGLLVLALAISAYGTPLDDYVAALGPPVYSITNTSDGTGYTTYTVQMTSQTWRHPSEVDHNAWQHYMKICVPDTVTTDKALLSIDGGSHGSVPWVDTALAVATGSVVASIANVPNQPLRFAGESYMGGGPGCVNTLWLALCRIRLAATAMSTQERTEQLQNAMADIRIALANTNPTGQLPELIPKMHFDYWAAPHAWACSLFVEAVMVLRTLAGERVAPFDAIRARVRRRAPSL